MNDFATTAMWDNAVRDRDAEEAREALVRSKVAVAGLWPFLAAAHSKDDFGHRLALQSDTILDRVGADRFDSVLASLADDWGTLHEQRASEHQLHVEAATKVVEGQDAMSYPAVAMYSTAAGDDQHYQVDHIASPKWLKTIHRGDDPDQARQAAKEFATSQGMPLYIDGKRSEGKVHSGQEFFHVASGTWMPVFSSAVDDVRAQMKGLNEMCQGSGAHAGKGHSPAAPYGFHAKLSSQEGQCKNCGQKVPVVMGNKSHGYLMAHWPEGAGIGDPKAAKLARFSSEQLSDEYSRFHQRPDWELEHIHHALSMTQGVNGPQEEARLEAVRRIKSERGHPVNAVFTPDPSDAERYNRYPTIPSPQTGGSAAGPPTQMGPDGFPLDLAEGEQRTPEAYQRQLTPGAWTVTPGSEWPVRPNAADMTQQPRTAAEHVAGEGVVPTPGPNPNYFSQGTQGLQGPPEFSQDPGQEPKTDNRVDDFYGDVPPVASSGTSQGPLDGQGYSRQGVEASLQAEANQYIKQQGGKWVITQKGTGKVLSHHDSEEEANASFRAMMQSKHGGAERSESWYSIGQQDHRNGMPEGRHTVIEPVHGSEAAEDYKNGYDEAKSWGASPRRWPAQAGLAPPPFAEAGTPHTASHQRVAVDNWVTIHHPEQGSGEPIRAVCKDCGPVATHPDIDLVHPIAVDHNVSHQERQYDDKHGQGTFEREFPHLYHDARHRTAVTDGRIVGHCDNCQRPVRWHEGDEGEELRHLHNSSNKCSAGGMKAKTSGVVVTDWNEPDRQMLLAGMAAFDRTADMSSDASDPNLAPVGSPSAGTDDTNVPQATDPNMPSQVTGRHVRADALEAPTSDNPTGRGEDEYRARNWDSAVKQRPMQSAEDRNINTPVMPQEPIHTLDTNGPRERQDADEDETDNEPARREASLRQEAASMGVPIVCMSCGTRGKVASITTDLRCRCGSTELDIDDFETTASQHVAYPQGPHEGWDKPMPSKTKGWSDYEGPQPGRNPQTSAPVSDAMICPSCHGSGYDVSDKTLCRMCNGVGTVKPTTGQPNVESNDATTSGPPVGGARWQGATASARVVGPVQISGGGGGGGTITSGNAANLIYISGRPSKADPYGTAEYQNMHGAPGYGHKAPDAPFNPDDARTFADKADTIAPAVHHRRQPDYDAPAKGNYQMNEASCPECGHRPTQLVKDRNENAWWHCPHCGPLANIDQHPEVNPYTHEGYQGRDPEVAKKAFGRKLGRAKKTGKLLSMIATISRTNDGIDPAQAVTLARNTIVAYREN